MKLRYGLVAALVAGVACGKSMRHPDEGEGGEAGVGAFAGSGGNATIGPPGASGAESAGGHIGLAGEGGAPKAGAPPGGGAGQTQGGDGGINGAAGADTPSVTVSDGLVTVTYVPGDDLTVVTVTIDPDCVIFAADMQPIGLICADVTLDSGSIKGMPRVCFKGQGVDKYIEHCAERTVPCKFPEIVHEVGDASYCCQGYYPDTSDPQVSCLGDGGFGQFAFGNGLDTDGDLVYNLSDNCRNVYNALQADQDGDRIGNVCDNCPLTPNQDQTDTNGDGIGDACTADGGAGGSGGDGGWNNAGAGGSL
jgi:hypothetical protein